ACGQLFLWRAMVARNNQSLPPLPFLGARNTTRVPSLTAKWSTHGSLFVTASRRAVRRAANSDRLQQPCGNFTPSLRTLMTRYTPRPASAVASIVSDDGSGTGTLSDGGTLISAGSSGSSSGG